MDAAAGCTKFCFDLRKSMLPRLISSLWIIVAAFTTGVHCWHFTTTALRPPALDSRASFNSLSSPYRRAVRIRMSSTLESVAASQLLRIKCSDIAAVSGLHPWVKVDEIFKKYEKYVYQDLDKLMELDAKNLDTELLTTEQEVRKILQKIGTQEKAALKALDTVTKDKTVLNNNDQAKSMLKQLQDVMKSNGVLNKLSSSELKLVETEFRGRVCKNYGINCERNSLDKYEEIIGFPVVARNLRIIRMNVMPIEDGGKSTTSDITPTSSEDHDEIKTGALKPKPSFVLVGKVDGISHQLDPANLNNALRVVVEMKSRVRGISLPPPLYEQIQLVSYMIMLDCQCGDLIQAVTRQPTPVATTGLQSQKPKAPKPDPHALNADEDFHVSRIQLDGPPFYHRKHWDTVVMPRLRQFRDAVYTMRTDDALRYAYLMSPPEGKLKMLQHLCPYFDV